MNDFKSRIIEAKRLIEEAEYIIVGAGAGLSEAAGFHYAGERFDSNFLDFKEKYGIEDMYSGTFFEFKSEEERWAFWARVIQFNTYEAKPTPVYQKILELLKDKKYFVLTTNADCQFFINGFDMNSYFETQGNYRYLQCKKRCHNKVYDNNGIIQQMVQQTKNCKIPTELVPICPACFGEMDVHVRKNRYFIETEGWHYYHDEYINFLKKALKHKVVFLEFGVGFNTPGIIRIPFEQMVFKYKNANRIRFNRDYPRAMKEIENKTVSFFEDILTVLNRIQGSENIESEGKRNISH